MTVTVRPASRSECVIPRELRPMLARGADGPLDDPAYAYEMKWDGMRVLAGVRGPRWSLITRNALEAAPRFPELAVLLGAVGNDAILDGEIITLRDGKPCFWTLQQRIQAHSPRTIEALAEQYPAALVLFDILRVGESWVVEESWTERRSRLEAAIVPTPEVMLSPVWDEGRHLWDTACRMDLEGVMAKLRSGRYTPGARSLAWRKIKIEASVDVVVGGWTEGAGERRGLPGALLVGRPGPGGLEYLGHVGSGFDAAELAEALTLLRPLDTATCPFRPEPRTNAPAHWVRPQHICEVTHQGWSAEGHLRAPIFHRWRPDKLPETLGT